MAQSKTVSGAEHESGFAGAPDHTISIDMADRPFTVLAHDVVIADRARALILREADYPPVYYLRREDITMALLERTAQTSWCPFKGRASYYSVKGDLAFENAVWSYEDPFLEAAPIKDHMAFYANRDGLIVKAA